MRFPPIPMPNVSTAMARKGNLAKLRVHRNRRNNGGSGRKRYMETFLSLHHFKLFIEMSIRQHVDLWSIWTIFLVIMAISS